MVSKGYYDMDVSGTPMGSSGPPTSQKRDQSYHLESAHYRNNDSVSLDVLTLVEQQHITTVAHVGFSDALIAQKPSPWTKTMFKLYCFLFIAFLNSCINGYDGSLMGGINAMGHYQRLVYFSSSQRGLFLTCFRMLSALSTFHAIDIWKL